jgi:hypothetical protein
MLGLAFANPLYDLPWAGVAYAHPAFVFEISFERYEHLISACAPAHVTRVNFQEQALQLILVVKVQF